MRCHLNFLTGMACGKSFVFTGFELEAILLPYFDKVEAIEDDRSKVENFIPFGNTSEASLLWYSGK